MPGGDPGSDRTKSGTPQFTTEVLDRARPGSSLLGVSRDHDRVFGQAVDVLVAFHCPSNGKTGARQRRGDEDKPPVEQELANIARSNRLLEAVRQNPDRRAARIERAHHRGAVDSARTARYGVHVLDRHTASQLLGKLQTGLIDIARTDDGNPILRQ